ncbi:MAG: DoxX family membrane protein [Candidatus Niyogibacteria bacterium]|nr:DoxX family membrane protein [Candidatus Niyogibacteria bacterium]
MKTVSAHILRIGLGITFVWIGVLILQNPAAWSGFIKPWVVNFLFTTPEKTMIGAGIFDLAVGFFLLINFWTFTASLLAALHLAIVLLVSGINAITVRDIGLLAGALALAFDFWSRRKNYFSTQKPL